jgi:hypothetical protein
LNTLKSEAKKFLKENPEVAKALRIYFSVDNWIDAMKCGETLTMSGLIECLNNSNWDHNEEIKSKLESNKHLWKTLLIVGSNDKE